MRDLLTGLAIILIVLLTAALVAPYFIDWNGQRAFVEARLSQALGQKVTIGGTIDVKLLPTPYLVLGQTVIGGDDGPIRIGIHHLALELSVPPLLHGEFDVVDARLEEPTIRVTLEPDRTLPALPNAPAFRADVSFDRISVADGTLAVADPQSGRTFVLDNLDFDADAPSLAGPFKGSGTEGAAPTRTKFHFATTTADRGRAQAQLMIEATAAHAGVDLDGTLALTSAGRETIRQSFDGKVTVSGRLDQADDAPIAWTLAGPLKADPEAATLDGGELRLGGEEAGLTLAATAKADLGTAPELHLDLSAKQLDFDRLAGAPTDTTAPPPPPKLPPLASIRQAIGAATPLPTHVDLSVDTATWGGETLSDLAAHFGVGGGADEKLTLAGEGPGHAHVGLDGVLSSDRFAGHVDLSVEDLPHLLGWLDTIDPEVTVKASAIPVRALKAKGSLRSDHAGVDLAGLALDLDRSALTGTARLAFADGARRSRQRARLDRRVPPGRSPRSAAPQGSRCSSPPPAPVPPRSRAPPGLWPSRRTRRTPPRLRPAKGGDPEASCLSHRSDERGGGFEAEESAGLLGGWQRGRRCSVQSWAAAATSSALLAARRSRPMRMLSSSPVRTPTPPRASTQPITSAWCRPMPAAVHVACGSTRLQLAEQQVEQALLGWEGVLHPHDELHVRALVHQALAHEAPRTVDVGEVRNTSISGRTPLACMEPASSATRAGAFS